MKEYATQIIKDLLWEATYTFILSTLLLAAILHTPWWLIPTYLTSLIATIHIWKQK